MDEKLPRQDTAAAVALYLRTFFSWKNAKDGKQRAASCWRLLRQSRGGGVGGGGGVRARGLSSRVPHTLAGAFDRRRPPRGFLSGASPHPANRHRRHPVRPKHPPQRRMRARPRAVPCPTLPRRASTVLAVHQPRVGSNPVAPALPCPAGSQTHPQSPLLGMRPEHLTGVWTRRTPVGRFARPCDSRALGTARAFPRARARCGRFRQPLVAPWLRHSNGGTRGGAGSPGRDVQ